MTKIKKYLFTSKYCGNCSVAKHLLRNESDITIIDITEMENTTEYTDIPSIPYLVVSIFNEGFKIKEDFYVGLNEIKERYVDVIGGN